MIQAVSILFNLKRIRGNKSSVFLESCTLFASMQIKVSAS